MLPFELKGLSSKKKWNLLKTGFTRYVFPRRLFGVPVTAQIEPVNFCNMTCPLCLTDKALAYSPKRLLPLEEYESFIDELGEYLVLIILWMWGEPFLHPQLFPMIACAKDRNIAVHTSTNGNFDLDENKAKELVSTGLDSLVFAIDGATQKTYSQYRRGGDLKNVLSNIEILIKARESLKTKFPLLNLRFVVMKHNEHEIEKMKRMARDLGVDVFTLKTADLPFWEERKAMQDFIPTEKSFQRYEYHENGGDIKKIIFRCSRPWKRITLNAHGEILSCEYDYQIRHSFGRFCDDENVLTIWKGGKADQFRSNFHSGDNAFYHCQNCTYKNMKDDDTVIEQYTFS
jgi:MoaA/NifB/PqqE/SkfB family radical SAM enzyme